MMHNFSPPRPSILVVDDNLALLTLVTTMLDSFGYQVTPATSGEQALAFLRRPASFAVLLTDLHMPGGIGGIALAAATATHAPETAIIVTSGIDCRPAELPAAMAFLAKPFTIVQLTELIGALVAPPPIRMAAIVPHGARPAPLRQIR